MRQARGKLRFQASSERVDANFIAEYFRLGDDLPRILSRINKDEHIGEAIRAFRGLRIVRQDPWECLISYMCATHANIPAVRNMIFNLSRRFGRKITLDGHALYTFPKPTDLAGANLRGLRRCKLGFRAERILQTSKMIADEMFDLEALRGADYEDAKSRLMSLPGVGQKVADCVLLFSLDVLEAFPVDIWMKRIILKLYLGHFEQSFVEKISGKGSIARKDYEKISSFGRGYFGEYAGYAQEYLFHYGRSQLKGEV